MKRDNPEFERFDKTMDALLKVSYSDLKADLDAEKAAKVKRKTKKLSVVGRASHAKD